MNIRFPCLGYCWKFTTYRWLLHKTAVTPLPMHWICCSLVLSHWIGLGLCRFLNSGPITDCNWRGLGLDKWLQSVVLTGVWSVIHALTWMVVLLNWSEIMAWMDNYIPWFYVAVSTYPCPILCTDLVNVQWKYYPGSLVSVVVESS